MAATVVALCMICTTNAFAGFTSGGFDDEYTTGYYSVSENTSEKQKTQELFNNKENVKRRAEWLDRGLVAVPDKEGVLVNWRCLGTDSLNLKYNLYRNGTRINSTPLTNTNYFDKDGKSGDKYGITEVINGEETCVQYETKALDKNYIEFSVEKYDADYIIDDGAVGDLDGDGQYELLLRRVPKDMNVDTRTAYPLIEAYKLNGKHMWTINIGPNEINEHDLNMMVYDFNGDGKSEVIMRSFEGTKDGKNNVITDKDGNITDYSKDKDNLAIFKDRQYIVSTPEYLSMYNGETGEEMARTDLLPSQEPLSSWSCQYNDTGRLTKRASHHTFGLAYLDGVTPSFVEVRGAWDNVKAAAWHIENNEFVLDWEADTPNEDTLDSIYGSSNHNLTAVDVDFDGKDEILSGPMAIDHDGTTMYSVKAQNEENTWTKLGHGDAFDVAKMNPDYDGYYVWACHETKNLPANIELHDARTGEVIFGYGKTKDTGRSRAADIDPTHRGFEVWGSTWTVPMNINGEKIADSWNEFKVRGIDGNFEKDEKGEEIKTSLPMNFKIYWDGDLLSEFLDGTRISKWNWTDKVIDVIMDADGCMSNCGTKAVPCVAADLFGDWRDEVVWKTEDESAVRIYSTTYETEYKIPTFMHDPYYRASIAMQNNHYNQPVNVSYYLGAETTSVPIPQIYTEKYGVRKESPDVGSLDIKVGKESSVSDIKMLIGCGNAYADGRIVKIDEEDSSVAPVIIDDNTFVPIRFIAENLGYKVEWNEPNVTISDGTKTIVMVVGAIDYMVDGEIKRLETVPRITNERTMIPVRAVAEAFGKNVDWNEKGIVSISNGETEKFDADKIIDELKNTEED